MRKQQKYSYPIVTEQVERVKKASIYTLHWQFVSPLLSLGPAKKTLGFILHDAKNVLAMRMFITTRS